MLYWFLLNDLSSKLKWCRNKRHFKDIPSSTCLNGSETRTSDLNCWGPRFNAHWCNNVLLDVLHCCQFYVFVKNSNVINFMHRQRCDSNRLEVGVSTSATRSQESVDTVTGGRPLLIWVITSQNKLLYKMEHIRYDHHSSPRTLGTYRFPLVLVHFAT